MFTPVLPGALEEGSFYERHRRSLLTAVLMAALMVGGFWAAALGVFLRREAGLSFTFPVRESHPSGLHNLALYPYGTHVRVSSFDHWLDSQHHPGFLVDGLKNETIDQKWATRPGDARPWVELSWRQPATLDRVVIRHAGVNENSAYTARAYSITCLTATGTGATLEVTQNLLAEVSHELRCADANGVRLTFWPNGHSELVRVFEVQVLGTLRSTP